MSSSKLGCCDTMYLLSKDDMVLHEDLGQDHGVVDVHIIVGGTVDNHERVVRYVLYLARQTRLNKLH